MVAPEQSGIMTFVAQYGQVIYFFAQMFFWLALSVSAIWATLLFRRLVNHQIENGTVVAESALPEPAATPESPVSVEEFVD